jgi:hypothetical protein
LQTAAQSSPNIATACSLSGANGYGRVSASSWVNQSNASVREDPHICCDGRNPEQQAGRSGWPKIRHWFVSESCTQRTPAGFPNGMPGIGLEMDGAMQHAPQFGRHA